MKQLLKLTALAACIGAPLAAHADPAETKGGIKIKTEDGRFEATVGGRIHFDGYLFDEDSDPSGVTGPFGSQLATNQERGGVGFRRAYLTLTGKLYGWKYKFENDFAAGASPGSFRELWVSTTLGPGELMLGQFKPFRGMEELTSSNDITMMERPWTSATGIYAGRQFLMGAGYKGLVADQFGYGVDVMNLGAAGQTTEGLSYGGRVYWAPMSADGNVLHLGFSASVDDVEVNASANANSLPASPAAPYAGRRGPSVVFGTAGAAACGGALNAAPACAGGQGLENSQTTLAAEFAWGFGPVAIQLEYATASLDNTHLDGGVQKDSDVDAMYAQIGWFVTGEQVTYKKDRGAFGKPKPNGPAGAWELTARYDLAENGDQSATAQPCSLGAGSLSCEASTITAGVNWYVNPNVRFMLNYYMGEADRGTPVNPTDEPQAVSLRTQLSF